MLQQETRDEFTWEVFLPPFFLNLKITSDHSRKNIVLRGVVILKNVSFVECDEDQDYEKFTLYILDHRKQLHPEFTTPMTFFFLGTQCFYGECFIAQDLNHRVIGALGYVYGTPECEFKDTHILRINMVHIAEHYRGGLLFYNGLKHFIHKQNSQTPRITDVQFFIPKENRYLNRLCFKFAKKIKETTSFGTEILYSTSFTELCKYIEKGHRHVEMVGDSQN